MDGGWGARGGERESRDLFDATRTRPSVKLTFRVQKLRSAFKFKLSQKSLKGMVYSFASQLHGTWHFSIKTSKWIGDCQCFIYTNGMSPLASDLTT